MVGNGQNSDFGFAQVIDDAVREAPERKTPNAPSPYGTELGILPE